jgi:hypothetical protein
MQKVVSYLKSHIVDPYFKFVFFKSKVLVNLIRFKKNEDCRKFRILNDKESYGF